MQYLLSFELATRLTGLRSSLLVLAVAYMHSARLHFFFLFPLLLMRDADAETCETLILPTSTQQQKFPCCFAHMNRNGTCG